MDLEELGLAPIELILERLSVGLVISDPSQADNPIVYVNDAFLKLSGHEREDVMYKNCRFLQGEDTDPLAIAKIRVALEQGTEVDVVLKNYRKDGVAFWNHLVITPLYVGTNNKRYFVGAQRDVTDMVQKELGHKENITRLEHDNRMLRKELDRLHKLVKDAA